MKIDLFMLAGILFGTAVILGLLSLIYNSYRLITSEPKYNADELLVEDSEQLISNRKHVYYYAGSDLLFVSDKEPVNGFHPQLMETYYVGEL